MTLKRIVLPALFVAAAIAGAVTTGCHGNSSISATATPSPVPTCGTCTPVPTATPGGPTPTPSPTPTSYQPLANNDAWNYACNASVTASKNVTVGPILQGVQTLADTLTVSDPGPPATYTLTADEPIRPRQHVGLSVGVRTNHDDADDTWSRIRYERDGRTDEHVPGSGHRQLYNNVPGPDRADYDRRKHVQQRRRIQIGYSSPIVSLYGEIDTKTQLAVGPVELDFPDYTTPLVCTLTGPPTINSVHRRP